MSGIMAARAANQQTAASANAQRILRFLRSKLAEAKRLELLHVVTDAEGDREGRVDAWPVNGGENASDLASEIEASAAADASALGGMNVYVLVASDGEGKSLGRCSFRVQGDTGGLQLAPTERPTLLGMRAQEMRHNEMSVQLSLRTALDMIESMKERETEARAEARELRAQVAEAQRQRIETIELFESLVSEKAKRDLEAARESRHERMQAEIIGKVSTLWPLVVHKLAGGKASVGGLAPSSQDLLTHFLANVSREEISRMASALPPEKQMILWEVIASMLPPEPATTTNGGPTNGAPS